MFEQNISKLINVQFLTAQLHRRLLLPTHPRSISILSPSIPVLIPASHSAVPCSSTSSIELTRHSLHAKLCPL